MQFEIPRDTLLALKSTSYELYQLVHSFRVDEKDYCETLNKEKLKTECCLGYFDLTDLFTKEQILSAADSLKRNTLRVLPTPEETTKSNPGGSDSNIFNECSNHNTYDFENDSCKIAKYYPLYFDKWFDKNTYNFEEAGWALAWYCSQHFDKWFDKNTYNFKESSWALAKFCFKYFDKWFDPNTYDFEDYSSSLVEFCQEHKSKWEQFVK